MPFSSDAQLEEDLLTGLQHTTQLTQLDLQLCSEFSCKQLPARLVGVVAGTPLCSLSLSSSRGTVELVAVSTLTQVTRLSLHQAGRPQVDMQQLGVGLGSLKCLQSSEIAVDAALAVADHVQGFVEAVVLRQPPLGFVDVRLAGVTGDAGVVEWAGCMQQHWRQLLRAQWQWQEHHVHMAAVTWSEGVLLVGLGEDKDFAEEV
uniref:Uncharacterized protein n=1 Tax=Tetradesmus obliquus TaxID=3088 RepID=A0A383WDU5_TETOB|eukprot:jgi/Sobl393_1/1875/SZX75289.1